MEWKTTYRKAEGETVIALERDVKSSCHLECMVKIFNVNTPIIFKKIKDFTVSFDSF